MLAPHHHLGEKDHGSVLNFGSKLVDQSEKLGRYAPRGRSGQAHSARDNHELRGLQELGADVDEEEVCSEFEKLSNASRANVGKPNFGREQAKPSAGNPRNRAEKDNRR